MSRALLVRTRDVARLRDLRFERARDAFAAALDEARAAATHLAAADAAQTRARQRLAEAQHGLAGDPAAAALRLALVDAAAAALVAAEDRCEDARRAAAQADLALDEARRAMLVAKARVGAIAGRVEILAQGVARRDEEFAAIESEERLAVRTEENA